MRAQIEAPAIVLKAAARGDILRVVRSVHPRGQRIGSISDAEAAVAETARQLENTARAHQRNINRLNTLRQRQDLSPNHVQSAAELTAAAGVDLIGRVVQRARLTRLNKTSGTLQTSTGDVIAWTAAASYVDALDVLFDGVPIQVTGPYTGDSLSIQSVLPAPRSYWRDDEDYEAAAELGGMTVMATGLVKKDLARECGRACQVCGHAFTKLTQASLADLVNGKPALVCRPCKEDWKQSLKAGA